MPQATRTLNPLHFEDLEPHRFEDLVRQLAFGYRNWRHLESVGRLGKDEGIDIRGIELVPASAEIHDPDEAEEALHAEERIWVIQCKRYQKITPQQIRTTVKMAIPRGTTAPYGLIVATACDATKKTHDAFRDEAVSRGVQEFELWTKGRLEDLLFQPRFDHLLFAYFNISLTIRRRSQLANIRQRLAIKRKLQRVFGGNLNSSPFPMTPVLIRDAEDSAYPYTARVPQFGSRPVPPWHLAHVHSIFADGLGVSRVGYVGWVKEDGTWDMAEHGPNARRQQLVIQATGFAARSGDEFLKDNEIIAMLESQVPEQDRAIIDVMNLIPFCNILEVDPDGDRAFRVAHIYCSFVGSASPYVGQTHWSCGRGETRGHEFRQLDPKQRKKFFK